MVTGSSFWTFIGYDPSKVQLAGNVRLLLISVPLINNDYSTSWREWWQHWLYKIKHSVIHLLDTLFYHFPEIRVLHSSCHPLLVINLLVHILCYGMGAFRNIYVQFESVLETPFQFHPQAKSNQCCQWTVRYGRGELDFDPYFVFIICSFVCVYMPHWNQVLSDDIQLLQCVRVLRVLDITDKIWRN